jgi:cytochrome c oxidase assembly protein subunit 15
MNRRFQKLALATTATTYLLILVGALVRASGAGMGCPDWPRCFGRWVPPARIEDVPARFAPYFNVRLAWTEYLNRLLGMTTGILVFATLVAACVYHRRNARVVGSSIGAFVGVGLAGWLGKKVVDHHLAPALVTVHMFVALAVVSLLIYATVSAYAPADGVRDADEPLPESRRELLVATLGTTALLMVQIAIGTRVRASLEIVAQAHPEFARGEWITHIGSLDPVHRTFALLVGGAVLALAAYVRRRIDPQPALRAIATMLAVGVLAQIAIGVGLAYGALPPVLQIAHVTIGSLMLGGLITLAMLSARLPVATTNSDRSAGTGSSAASALREAS